MARSASDEASVMGGADAPQAIAERNLRWKTEHFAEDFIEGREFNLALLEGPGGVEVLPIAEIVFEGFGSTARQDRRLRRQMDARQRGLYRHAAPLRARAGRARACRRAGAARPGLAGPCSGFSSYARVDFRVDQAGAALHPRSQRESVPQPRCGVRRGRAGSRARLMTTMIGRIVEGSLGRLQATA